MMPDLYVIRIFLGLLPLGLYSLLPPVSFFLAIRWRNQIRKSALTVLACIVFLIAYLYSPFVIRHPYWRAGFEFLEVILTTVSDGRLSLPFSETRLSASVGDGYVATYVNTPNGDFYESHFVITRSDGMEAVVEIDPETSKCWEPLAIHDGAKLKMDCEDRLELGTYVDLAKLAIVQGDCSICVGVKITPLAELNYK